MRNMLIEYIKEEKTRRTYGVMVAFAAPELQTGFRLGISVCDKVEDWDRHINKELAIHRANNNEQITIPDNELFTNTSIHLTEFGEWANKYFKARKEVI